MRPLDLRSLALVATSIASLLTSSCGSEDPGAVTARDHGPAASAGNSSPPPAASTASPSPGNGGPPPATADAGASNGDASAGDAGASDAPTGLVVASFTLLDTTLTAVQAGSPVNGQDPMTDNSTISQAQAGVALSVRANLGQPIVGSVGFVYDTNTLHTEGAPPYTLCGDNGLGTIVDCNLALGTHTVTATPYSAPNLGGTAGTPLTITFTLGP